MQKSLYDKLFEYGCKLLKYKDRSVFEIKEKLRTKSNSEKYIDEVIEKFVQLGYLDDQRFTERYIDKWLTKGKSLNLILYELKEKYKISREILNNLDIKSLELKEFESVVQVINKKFKKVDKEKIFKFLFSRGFSEEKIEIILNKLKEK
jgi:regulatory protein